MKDFYKILGIARTADEKEIKKAYRKLARDYHPDRNPGDKEAEKSFLLVSEAYDILSDSKKRAAYDDALNNPNKSNNGTKQHKSNTSRQQRSRPYNFNPENFNDMFDSFFGKATPQSTEEDKVKKQVNNMFNNFFMGGK